jgi:threonine/homoserine/homoserine lactone efflux protein
VATPLFFFWKGLFLGFSIAAPVGPVGLLCIRRTLAGGRWLGLFTGLGAAAADAAYGAIAGFGLTLISNFLIQYQGGMRFLGGIFLCYLGIKTLISTPMDEEPKLVERDLGKGFLSTFLITLTNPMTILAFVAMFAGVGLTHSGGSVASVACLVAGVFAGSTLWWLFLSSAANALRSRVDRKGLTWVNRVSGTMIAMFGFTILWASKG